MDDCYVAKPLASRQIDQAYPVVRAFAPDVGVERWRAFANAMLADSARRRAGRRGGTGEEDTVALAGIMTVQSKRGYIHGLFSYGVDEHLRHGRILQVENFVVLDLFDPAAAAAVLLRAMDQLARGFSCGAIHTNLPDRMRDGGDLPSSILNYFRTEGHAVDTLRLCKALDGANDNAVAAGECANDGE